MGTTIRACRVLVLLAAAAVALSACSTTTAGTPQSAPANAADSTAVTGSAPTGSALAGQTPSLATGSDKEFCLAALNLGKELVNGNDSTSDPAGLKNVTDAWSKLAAIAPAEIKGDLAQIAAAFQQAAASPNSDPQSLLATMKGPLQHYTAWGATHCAGVTGN